MPLRFLADLGIAPSVVRELRRLGYDAIHVIECLPATSADCDILAYAAREGRVVLTMDHDFGGLLFSNASVSPSVVFFRVTDEKPASILRHMAEVLSGAAEDLAAGAIVTVEDTRIRVRLLPISPSR